MFVQRSPANPIAFTTDLHSWKFLSREVFLSYIWSKNMIMIFTYFPAKLSVQFGPGFNLSWTWIERESNIWRMLIVDLWWSFKLKSKPERARKMSLEWQIIPIFVIPVLVFTRTIENWQNYGSFKNWTSFSPGDSIDECDTSPSRLNLNRDQYIIIQQNAFENVAYKMASISSLSQCVNILYGENISQLWFGKA